MLMQLRDSCSRLCCQTKAGAGKIPLATQDTLACKKALRMGYSEICFRTELGGGRERGEPAMVLVRFEYLCLDLNVNCWLANSTWHMSNKWNLKAQTCSKTVLGCRQVAGRLNHVRKVRKRCSHSRFSFQVIILRFFDRNVGLCCSCFSVAMGDSGYFRWVKQWREVKDQSRGKGGRTQIIQGPLQALLSHAPLAIRKQISEYNRLNNPYREPVCRLRLHRISFWKKSTQPSWEFSSRILHVW